MSLVSQTEAGVCKERAFRYGQGAGGACLGFRLSLQFTLMKLTGDVIVSQNVS